MGGGRLPLELSVIGFGAQDRAGVLRLAKELLAKNQTPREAAEEAVRQGLREHPVRVSLYAEDQGALQKSLSLLVQILEKGGSPARLEAQGVYLREEAPLSSDSVAFMFPGQGSQYVGMMDELRAKYPIVEQTLQEADATMEKFLPKRLSLYMTKDASQDEMESFFALSQTEVLQPAILASDEAIRRLISPLITPRMVFGHSLGEYGACVAAGVMSFSNALRIVAAREGALANVEIKDNGKMLAVGTNEETINRLLKGIKGYVVVVNKNCPSQTIIGGETSAVEEAEAKLKAAGLEGVYLPVSHAFHSDIVGPGSVPLLEELRKIEIHTPRLSILSNVTAQPYQADPEWIRTTLAKQMASPVEFINMVENAYALGVRVFVEVGPKRAQSGFIGDILKGRPHRALFVCHPKQGELTSLGRAIASLCADGVISYGGLREEPASQAEAPRQAVAPREEPSKRLQPLPEPFFIRQLRLEDAPPRAPLPFSIEESRTCILYSPETEHLLPLFSGVAIDVSVEPNEATIKEKLGGESCEVLLDLCLFGEQAVQDVLGAALFHTKRVLRIAKLFHEQKPKRVLVYTPLGGGFGIPNESFESPSDAVLSAVGAAIGSWKSVIREWHGEGLPWYPLSIIDLPAQPSSAIWQEAKQELLSSSSFEVSLLETSLGVLRRAPKYCIGVHPESALLKKSSVVALLGGGRGITSTIATQLAKDVGCRLSLFGRTQSRPEVPAFDRARALFTAKEQLGPTASRSQLQKRAEELLRQKELAATLSQLKEQGADFFYQQGDIRFANQVRNFLEETVRRFGTIDAIIYGSGIDRSRGLQNKTEAEVDEVLSTFLQSEIFKFCKEKNCKLVVLGSLSSRYGNFGQLDYGAAHEALAKIARGLPASLVLDFTAWSEIGMAAPLASTFKERGIDLLPPSIGARVAVDAMQSGLSGEWVVSGKVPQPNLGGAFLQGRAELFVPWSALRQSATARESLLVNGKIHPAFLIEAAREAAQSIFLPVKVTSMHATLTESGSSKITILAEQEKQSGQEVCCRVQVTGEAGELLTCTTTTRKQMVRPVQTPPDKKSISVRDQMSRYEPAHRLIERAWSDGERPTGAARSVVLVAHDGISRGVLARLFLLQAASLFGHTFVEREHEIIFLQELATPTAIAIIEDGSCVLQDAEGVICEVWSAPATTGRR